MESGLVKELYPRQGLLNSRKMRSTNKNSIYRKVVVRDWNVWCVRSGPSSRHQDKGHCAAVVLRGHLRKTKESKRGEKSLHAVTQVWHTYERQEELQTEAGSPKKASAKSWHPKRVHRGTMYVTWMGHHGYFGCVQSLGLAQEKSDLKVKPRAKGLGKQEGLSQPAFLEQIWKGTFLWSLATLF